MAVVRAACFRCGTAVEVTGAIGRREACLSCGQELRCCRSCGFYDPTLHNSCREPQAELQVDKERANFCEYFRFGPTPGVTARQGAHDDARSKLDALFRHKGK